MDAPRPRPRVVAPEGVGRVVGHTTVVRAVADAVEKNDASDARPPLLGRDKVAAAADAEIAAFGAPPLGGVRRVGRPGGPAGVSVVLETAANRMVPAVHVGANVGVGAGTAACVRAGALLAREVGVLDVEPEAATDEARAPVAPDGAPMAGGVGPTPAWGRAAAGPTRAAVEPVLILPRPHLRVGVPERGVTEAAHPQVVLATIREGLLHYAGASVRGH